MCDMLKYSFFTHRRQQTSQGPIAHVSKGQRYRNQIVYGQRWSNSTTSGKYGRKTSCSMV